MIKIPFDPYDFFGYIASGLVLVVGLSLVFEYPNILERDLSTIKYAILILAIYVSGQIIASPAKFLLEDFIIDKILRRPSTNLFRNEKPTIGAIVFPGYYRTFPVNIQDAIKSKAKAKNISATGEPLFLTVRYSSSVLNNDKLIYKLNEMRNKYGFNRNLSFTCFLIGIIILVKSVFFDKGDILEYGIYTLIVSVLLFYRYLKFFWQYSYELFLAYNSE